MTITLDERLEIAKHLQTSHSLFRKFWDLGNPIFVKDVPTAAVTFDENGDLVEFLFNEDFWTKLPTYDKAFIIAHEMLHILLEHGRRINDKDSDREIANQAMDICVNGLLANNFGFQRNKLVIEQILGEELCWFETIFKNSKKVERNREAEYYYNILKQLKKKGHDTVRGRILDGHLTEKEAENLLGKVISDLKDDITNDPTFGDILEKLSENPDNKMIMSAIHAGRGTGNWIVLHEAKVQFSKKWNSIIKKKDVFREHYDIIDVETFLRKNKRMEFILDDDLLLPTECMIDTYSVDKNKVGVFMFLDASGSCISYKDKFFAAYNSIDKRVFDVRIFSFDEVVKELDAAKHRIYGGMGTNFGIIEKKIQTLIKDEKLKRYPYVFVVSDGYGTFVAPQYPAKWHFFITDRSSTTRFVPAGSHIHSLSEYT